MEGLEIHEGPDGLSFKVKVQPRASRSQITGMIGDALKIQLTSPPVDGAANAACAELLSEVLDVAKTRIVIAAGAKSRSKVIRVAGLRKEDFIQLLVKHMGK